MANSVDPDQTPRSVASVLDYTPCPGLSLPIRRVIIFGILKSCPSLSVLIRRVNMVGILKFCPGLSGLYDRYPKFE